MRCMAESGQRDSHPAIIDRRALRSKGRIAIEGAITLGFWVVYLHCLLPMARVFVPDLPSRLPSWAAVGPFRVALDETPAWGLICLPPSTLSDLLVVTGRIALVVAFLYIVWICYNYTTALVRPGRSRRFYPALGRTQAVRRRRGTAALVAGCAIFLWTSSCSDSAVEESLMKAGPVLETEVGMAAEKAILAALRPCPLQPGHEPGRLPALAPPSVPQQAAAVRPALLTPGAAR